jgi:hypothetical protein
MPAKQECSLPQRAGVSIGEPDVPALDELRARRPIIGTRPLAPREAEALAAPHNPVFVHMGERVPVEMPALASFWNHAPTTIDGRVPITCHIGNYGVQLHVKRESIVGGNTAAQASFRCEGEFPAHRPA